MDERGPEFTALAQRAENGSKAILHFAQDTPQGCARWVELGAHLRLSESPLNIAEAMRSVLRSDPDLQSQKSWVFTSATLGVDDQLSWFVNSCGLDDAQVLQVESPFDYMKQASVYVPPDFPKPSEAGHTQAVAQLIFEGASRLNGRTLVLTTTTKAMHSLGSLLRALFADSGIAMDILVQGEAAKRALIDRFCKDPKQEECGCILVATASFWEGIDIAGDALQLLVIDKLPFAPPDDPLMQSRAHAMEALGQNAFKDLHLPTASIALKQGAGRLIRSEIDRGILVVCDVRLLKMGYGRKLMSALPPMQRLPDQDAWHDALNALRSSLPITST
jgi:ATP-dependent DNA helicase DinG